MGFIRIDALMKRGGRPKTLPTSSECATAATGTGGSWTEASAVAAERLADWQQNLSDQNDSPEIDETNMPELQHQGSLRLSTAPGSTTTSSTNATASLAPPDGGTKLQKSV